MIEKLKSSLGQIGYIIYLIGFWFTFIYLIFFDGYRYNAWNWIIVIPIDMSLSWIWPIYWLLLHWIK